MMSPRLDFPGRCTARFCLTTPTRCFDQRFFGTTFRTTAQCEFITDTLSVSGLSRLVGNPALEGFTAPKLLWVRDEEPDVFDQVKTVLLPKDYIRLLMTGEKATEPSDAAGTLLFDVVASRWSDEMLTTLELDPHDTAAG